MMAPGPHVDLVVTDLVGGYRGISAGRCLRCAETASLCLEHHHGTDPVALEVPQGPGWTCTITPMPLTPECKNSYEPQEEAESGAEGIALLLLGATDELINFKRVKNRKTGFDFWVGAVDDEGMFQNRKRLEVSGILSGSRGELNQRVREKKRQTEQSAGLGPAVVVVVEFSQPTAWAEEI